MSRGFRAALIALLLVVVPAGAQAESGKINLHLDLGYGGPFLGYLSAPGDVDGESRSGPVMWGAFDLLPSEWLVFEGMIGVGYLINAADQGREPGAGYWCIALGARGRWLDDREGYNDEIGGNIWGNFWVSAHIGYHNVDSVQFGLDVAAGYEFSLHRPYSIGPFVRTLWLLEAGGGREGSAAIFFGASFSMEVQRRFEEIDGDNDGLSDTREAELGTDAGRDDTDGDFLPDGLEARTRTNPLVRDTDSDGLTDSQEDADRDGIVDGGETDPRQRDTDRDGVPDADERYDPSMNATMANTDRDGDGVEEEDDACPGTPAGARVGPNGCALLSARFELRGIQFRPGSARIHPDSEETLQRLVQILDDNPTVRIEVSGHTDSQGRRRNNVRLSEDRAEAVRRWLIRAGVEPVRIEAVGRGPDNPIADNETEEGRARNRRIEIRRLDEDGGSSDDE